MAQQLAPEFEFHKEFQLTNSCSAHSIAAIIHHTKSMADNEKPTTGPPNLELGEQLYHDTLQQSNFFKLAELSSLSPEQQGIINHRRGQLKKNGLEDKYKLESGVFLMPHHYRQAQSKFNVGGRYYEVSFQGMSQGFLGGVQPRDLAAFNIEESAPFRSLDEAIKMIDKQNVTFTMASGGSGNGWTFSIVPEAGQFTFYNSHSNSFNEKGGCYKAVFKSPGQLKAHIRALAAPVAKNLRGIDNLQFSVHEVKIRTIVGAELQQWKERRLPKVSEINSTISISNNVQFFLL